jgi:nitrate reductase alpha subunit
VATVFDLTMANYGIDRGLGGGNVASYDDDVPYTPAWQEAHRRETRRRDQVAREFAENADQTMARAWSSSARR